MELSIFHDKAVMPTNKDLNEALKGSFIWWMEIREFVFDKYPTAKEEWNHSGKKYGWNFRIKDKRRTLIYLLPRQDYFKVAFVFGQKSMNKIRESEISDEIITELENAKVYAGDRGIRIDIKDESKLVDVKKW
jgi:hypothetical protein